MSTRLTIFFIALSITCFILAIYTVQSARPNVDEEDESQRNTTLVVDFSPISNTH